jgi:hypothetical protein
MPLLSRLFGRKHQDDDKMPSAEWPLGAPPLGDRSFDAAPFVPYKPPADDAEIESGSEAALSEVAEEDAADDADTKTIPTEPERTESEAEPLAAVARADDEAARALSRPDGEDAAGASESQDIALEVGEGPLEVVGTDDNHEVSSNGSVAETSFEASSLWAIEPDDDTKAPADKESADAFTASGEPMGTGLVETSDLFARPASTAGAPFNALAAAASDAFEMPIEEMTDPFDTSPNDLPERTAPAGSASADTLFRSQGTRSNPFMKLVAEAHEGEPVSHGGGKHLDLVQPAPAQGADRLTTFAVPPAAAEPHTLIGGKEDDIVPLIPDTETGEAPVTEIDESGIAEAAVASLKGACDFLVGRVKKLSTQDGTRVVAGLIALVGELDARYALDMGIRRRNGVEELLIDVRGRMAEGDRFILESLENGRGGLTADAFLRDLKTIAPGDRPRMLGHYVVFLTFMITRVLHQYIQSLEEDQTRTYEISYHLDYQVEGVRDMLMSKVTAGAS